jgi:hypothetical protein
MKHILFISSKSTPPPPNENCGCALVAGIWGKDWILTFRRRSTNVNRWTTTFRQKSKQFPLSIGRILWDASLKTNFNDSEKDSLSSCWQRVISLTELPRLIVVTAVWKWDQCLSTQSKTSVSVLRRFFVSSPGSTPTRCFQITHKLAILWMQCWYCSGISIILACPSQATERFLSSTPVFLNRRAADRYRALALIIPGRENLSL